MVFIRFLSHSSTPFSKFSFTKLLRLITRVAAQSNTHQIINMYERRGEKNHKKPLEKFGRTRAEQPSLVFSYSVEQTAASCIYIYIFSAKVQTANSNGTFNVGHNTRKKSSILWILISRRRANIDAFFFFRFVCVYMWNLLNCKSIVRAWFIWEKKRYLKYFPINWLHASWPILFAQFKLKWIGCNHSIDYAIR